jgi:hypothetical protein
MFEVLSEDNFLLYAAKHYDNKNCTETEEFLEDLDRFKYIKKLMHIYKNRGILRERLILNHLIILYNVFEPRACTRMLFLKLNQYLDCLIPFLEMLNYLPDHVMNVGERRLIVTKDIPVDDEIDKSLRKIINGSYKL